MKKLIHWFRLMFEPSGRDIPFYRQPKRFKLVYPDGQVSMPMAYDVACGYKEIYGGEVKKV